MIRHCTGTDPNLIRDGEPCDCGRTFDDVERLVIYPHTRIPSATEKAAILDLLSTVPVEQMQAVVDQWARGLVTDGGSNPVAALRQAIGEVEQTSMLAGQRRPAAAKPYVCRHGRTGFCPQCTIIISGDL
jgi:hypothetical protein